MQEDSRDETDHDLFRPALQRLYLEELNELGGKSCRDRLSDILESRWEQLASQSCRRMQRPIPTHEDALLAFDSLKHFLLGDINLLDLSLPELWRFLRRVRLSYWLWLATTGLGLFATVATIAFQLGQMTGE